MHKPFRAGVQIFFVLRLGGDAGKTQIIAELGDEARLMEFQIIENGLHDSGNLRNESPDETAQIRDGGA